MDGVLVSVGSGETSPLSLESLETREQAVDGLLTSASPDAHARVDRHGVIRAANAAFGALLDTPIPQLVGGSLRETAGPSPTLTPPVVERCLRVVTLAIERRAPQRLELELAGPSNVTAGTRWIELRVFPTSDGEAELALREISEEINLQRRQQAQLRDLQRALASMRERRETEQRALAERLRELAGHPATAGTATALEALADVLGGDPEVAPDALEDQLGRLLADRCAGRLKYRARMKVRPEYLTPRIAGGLVELAREAVDCIVGMQVERVGLTLENDHEALLLRITDDGVPPPPAEHAPCIATLQHRASELGGSLSVTHDRSATALQLRLLLD